MKVFIDLCLMCVQCERTDRAGLKTRRCNDDDDEINQEEGDHVSESMWMTKINTAVCYEKEGLRIMMMII